MDIGIDLGTANIMISIRCFKVFICDSLKRHLHFEIYKDGHITEPLKALGMK